MTDAQLDALWGATLDGLDIDIVAHTVEMRLVALTESVETRHRLIFDSVTEFRFHNSIPDPWNHAEVTEVHAVRLSNARIRMEMVLWSEDAGLALEAGSVAMDGQALTIARG